MGNESHKHGMIIALCALMGVGIPLLMMQSYSKTIIFVAAGVVFAVLLLIKKGRVTIFDWFAVFLLAIPLHTLRIMFGKFFLRPTELVFIPFVIWWIAQVFSFPRERRNLFHVHTEYLILIFFFLFTLMSTLVSADIRESAYRTTVLLYLLVCSFIVSKILQDQQKIWLAIKILIISSACTGVYAFLQSFFPRLHFYYPVPLTALGAVKIYRAGMGWQNPNYYALYLTMIIPLTYIGKNFGLFRGKMWLRVCLLLQLLGLVASYSRLGVISLFLTYVSYLWLTGRRYRSFVLVVVILLVLVIAFQSMIFLYEHNPFLSAFLFRVYNLEEVLNNPLLIAGWRRDAWIANVRMFLDKPVLGIGPFMSTAMYVKYRPVDEVYPNVEGLAVHSEYLSLLSERGFLGAFSFLLFLFFICLRTYRYFRKRPHTREGSLMMGLYCSLLNFIFFSVGGATIYSVEFWIIVGIILAICDATPASDAAGASEAQPEGDAHAHA